MTKAETTQTAQLLAPPLRFVATPNLDTEALPQRDGLIGVVSGAMATNVLQEIISKPFLASPGWKPARLNSLITLVENAGQNGQLFLRDQELGNFLSACSHISQSIRNPKFNSHSCVPLRKLFEGIVSGRIKVDKDLSLTTLALELRDHAMSATVSSKPYLPGLANVIAIGPRSAKGGVSYTQRFEQGGVVVDVQDLAEPLDPSKVQLRTN